ncbi:hypothetical protein [Kribbella catacumbae]|uniref:hypothetical protein n=1 Tax=Kribbella catacumbae TaxID=460086 RepID=UPI0003656969|nr:hypothetical protein [Kribbella catacumbae]
MTQVNLLAVYRLAESLRLLGLEGGDWLTTSLDNLRQSGIAEACGSDEMGVQISEGYNLLADGLADAGATLETSLVNIGDGVSGGANLLRQTDGHNAEAVKAADLGLRADGTILPATPGETGS